MPRSDINTPARFANWRIAVVTRVYFDWREWAISAIYGFHAKPRFIPATALVEVRDAAGHRVGLYNQATRQGWLHG